MAQAEMMTAVRRYGT